MNVISFYLVFLIGIGAWVTGYFWKRHQQAFMLHMIAFGFSLISAIGAQDVTHISGGVQVSTTNPIMGAVSLGFVFLASGCMVYRASASFSEQGGPL